VQTQDRAVKMARIHLPAADAGDASI
jgi:hypothetical protein